MGQTISEPQTVLKQARPFKKTRQTTGQTILEQAGQTIQTISKERIRFKMSQIVAKPGKKQKQKQTTNCK